MLTGLAGASFFIFILLLVVAVCWIILPFAILGTKPLLRELLAEQKRTNELLAAAPRETPVFLVRK